MNLVKRMLNGFLDALYPNNLRCAVCGEELNWKEAQTSQTDIVSILSESASTETNDQTTSRTETRSETNDQTAARTETVCPPFQPKPEGICPNCILKLSPLPTNACPHCASSLSDGVCPDCGGKGFAFRTLRAAYVYETAIKSMILGYKENGETWRKEMFSSILSQMITNSGVEYNAISFPPSGARAKRRRGFDHMRLIAKRVSELTGIPLLECLTKHEVSEKHAKLTRSERMVAAEEEYEVSCEFAGCTVAVLDDVATSCATLNSVTKSIKIATGKNDFTADAYVVARTFLK